MPFEIVRRVVDRVVTVDEASIALAILRLIELEKSVVEGAGAAPLAAFLAGKLDALKGKRVVLVLAGGNIDSTMLGRVIEVGLVADGRLARFTVSISDRPGGLARLAELIASTGASIKEIVHDRAFSGPDLSAVRVVCVVETTGHDARARGCTTRRLERAGGPVERRFGVTFSSGCPPRDRRTAGATPGRSAGTAGPAGTWAFGLRSRGR